MHTLLCATTAILTLAVSLWFVYLLVWCLCRWERNHAAKRVDMGFWGE